MARCSLQYINELLTLSSFALSPKAAANVYSLFLSAKTFFLKKNIFFFSGGQLEQDLYDVALRTPFRQSLLWLR